MGQTMTRDATNDRVEPFNTRVLYDILGRTTVQLRKGAEVVSGHESGVDTVSVFAMPPVSVAPEGIEQVDVHFIVVGVNKEAAEKDRDLLVSMLNQYPEPDQLRGGPSYIHVGGTIGDQGAALQLFALGKVLGLWSVITPATFGMTGLEADQAAGAGFVMISGFTPAQGPQS